jgi:hypothetical protein
MNARLPTSIYCGVNQLFATLVLQLDFVERHQLLAAIRAWAGDQSSPLGEALVRQGLLSDQRRQLLDELIQERLSATAAQPEHGLGEATAAADVDDEVSSAFLPHWSRWLDSPSPSAEPPDQPPISTGHAT